MAIKVPPPAVPISVTRSGGSLVAGTKVSLTCSILFASSVDTEVMVNVTWKKNSTRAGVTNDSISYIDDITYVSDHHNLNNHTSALVFYPVGSGDSGLYTCAITLQSLAPYTMLYSPTINNVSDLRITPLRNPNVSIINSSYTFAINQPYLLTCHVMADDGLVVPIDITWTKINGMVTEILNVTRNSNISSYNFSSLSLTDSALYNCTAAISFPRKGIENSVSAFADISLKPPDMVMSAGTSFISETELSFKWDQPHLINGALRRYSVTLSVLEDYGVLYNSTSYVLDPATTTYNASGLGAGIPYMVCVSAANSAGAGKTSCVLLFTKELETTAVPNNVAVQRSPDGLSMNVSWVPVSLAKARGFPLYVVSYSPQNSLRTRTAVMQVLTNRSFIVIPGLDPYQSYSVTLGVKTLAGSISSNTSYTSVLSSPSLTIAQVTSTSITVMWSQHVVKIGTTYTLSFTYQGPCAGVVGGGNVSVGTATQYTITGLQEFSVYTLTITASIGVVSSPPASVLVNTSSAAPSAPPNNLIEVTMTSSSMTISWGEVPCLDQNSVIVGYSVLYGAVTSGVGGTVASTSGRALTVNGLYPYTNYSIKVSAVNSDGAMGPYSSPLFVVTSARLFGAVAGLQAINNTFTTITLTWQPIVLNGMIIIYQVTYSAKGVVNTYNTATPSVIITGLVPRTTYTFSVSAYTITGPGTPQQVQTSTADIPNVSGVVVLGLNNTFVRVSWLAVQLPPDGILTGYTVYYRSLPNTSKSQSGGYHYHAFPPTTTSGDINNLNADDVYQFSVVAEVTIMGQLYSGELTMSMSSTPISIPVSPSMDSTSYWSGVLVASLFAEFVVLFVSTVIIIVMVVKYMRKSEALRTRKNDVPSDNCDVIAMKACDAYGEIRAGGQDFYEVVDHK